MPKWAEALSDTNYDLRTSALYGVYDDGKQPHCQSITDDYDSRV